MRRSGKRGSKREKKGKALAGENFRNDPEKYGVRVSDIVRFTEENQCWDFTTREVVNDFIVPQVRKIQKQLGDGATFRFAELELGFAPCAARFFVSHAWSGAWGVLVAALKSLDEKAQVWLDVFCVKQVVDHGEDQVDLDFLSVVRQLRGVVMISSPLIQLQAVPLEDVKRVRFDLSNFDTELNPFNRAWCLGEIAAACGATTDSTEGNEIPVVLMFGTYRPQQGARHPQFSMDENLFSTLRKVWYSLKIENAMATKSSDRDFVLARIDFPRCIKAIRGFITASYSWFNFAYYLDIVETMHRCSLGFVELQDLLDCIAEVPEDFGFRSKEVDVRETRRAAALTLACMFNTKLLREMLTLPSFQVCVDVEVPVKQDHNPFVEARALHFASECGSLSAVRQLLSHGSDVSRPRGGKVHEYTPLHAAARGGHSEIIELLIEHGHPLEMIYRDRGTPLMYAASNNMGDAVRTLIKHGAKSSTKYQGKSPQDYAEMNGHKELALLLEGAALCEQSQLDSRQS